MDEWSKDHARGFLVEGQVRRWGCGAGEKGRKGLCKGGGPTTPREGSLREAMGGQGAGGAGSNGGVVRVVHSQTGTGMGNIADVLQIMRDHTLVGKKMKEKHEHVHEKNIHCENFSWAFRCPAPRDADPVPALPLLQREGVLQHHPLLHRRVHASACLSDVS